MNNSKIANLLEEYAKLIRTSKGNSYRALSCERAANVIRSLEEDISTKSNGEILAFEGFGRGILQKIRDIAEKGTFSKLESLRNEFPSKSEQIRADQIEEIPKNKHPREMIAKIAEPFVNSVNTLFDAKAHICGSFRRGKKFCGDCDILVCFNGNPEEIADFFREYVYNDGGDMRPEAANGRVKVFAVIDNINIDLRILPKISEGAGLLYFTGSGSFNQRCRSYAKTKGMKLNEYGLFDRETEEQIPVFSEREILEHLMKVYIPPVSRD